MPPSSPQISFGSFRIDSEDARVWREDEVVSLTPKAFALLEFLARHPERLVTKDQLLDALWGDTIVGDAVLKVAVREIRKALGDDPKRPTVIETVHRRGYRFVAPIDTEGTLPGQPNPSLPTSLPERQKVFGRAACLDALAAHLADATRGTRQLVLLSGEPGIGKSFLLDAVLDRARHSGKGCLIGTGQCVEHQGAGEPYLPVLQAVSDLCRADPDGPFVDALLAHAPTWVAQVPVLASRVDAHLRREIVGATHVRMLREFADLILTLGGNKTLVLAIEDLHWVDPTTLELLSLLIRQRDPGRILILGTYRPSDVAHDKEIQRRVLGLLALPGGHEIALDSLSDDAVAEFVRHRFGGRDVDDELFARLLERTGGHPLFLTHAVDHLVETGSIHSESGIVSLSAHVDARAAGIPKRLRALFEERLGRLSDEQRQLMEVASIAGQQFDVDVVGGLLPQDVPELEVTADYLVTCALLRPLETTRRQGGTVIARFAFQHALVQQVTYESINPARRVRLHRQLAEHLARLDAVDQLAVTTSLARHYEVGQVYDEALTQLGLAATHAARRFANELALTHLDRATAILGTHGASLECESTHRLELLGIRGSVERSLGDMRAAAGTFAKLGELARSLGDHDREAHALLALSSSLFWFDRERCLETSDAAKVCAAEVQDATLRAHILGWCGHWDLTLRGWSDHAAEEGEAAVDAVRAAGREDLLGVHLVRVAYARMLRGDYAGATSACEEGGQLALSQGDGFDLLLSQFLASWAQIHAGHLDAALAGVAEAQRLAERNGHEPWRHLFCIQEAHAREQGGDYPRALELCDAALSYAQRHPESAGQLTYHGAIIAGLAALGMDRVEDAEGYFAPVQVAVETRTSDVDRMLTLPLALGRARVALAQRRIADARSITSELIKQASSSGEPYYLEAARELEAATRALDTADD